MAFRVQLREHGGVAGIQRSVALEGGRLRVLDRGEVRAEKDLPPEALRTVESLVKALEDIGPRRSYGQVRYASDILTTELSIFDDSKGLKVEVVSDPTDPAPSQFWDVVNDLRKLRRMGIQTKVADA